jgi:ATP-dependent Lon protease
MDQDVKKWITHININNTRKRKATFNEDNLIKELTVHSIKNISNTIKKEKIKNNKLELFLTGLKYVFTQSKKIYAKNTKSKNNEAALLISACSAITIKIIDEIIEAKHTTKNFDVFTFLEEKKKENYIPNKERKLSKLNIDTMSNKNDKTEDSYDTEDSYQDEDSDYIEGDNDDNDTEGSYDTEGYSDTEGDNYDNDTEGNYTKGLDDLDKNTINFISELKKITKSANGTNSKNDIIDYFKDLDKDKKEQSMEQLAEIIKENNNKMPYLFKLLRAPIKISTKKTIISKMFSLDNFGSKNRKWIEDVMKIPFGEYKGLELTSIKSKHISKFLNNLTELMDSAVYGHDNAKKQIVNLMAQQIRNPSCQGSVIALYGPPGTGKTLLIKEGIAKAMDKPFIFISLGGAQDSSFLDGHSFTYEGSIYGRIAQALIDAKCMNPIIYFDELDKVSESHKGDEIINLLIHLIDPVQNKLFRDKYFYDIDLDLSKVTFIFSFNDPSKISYILRDRITMIETKYLTNDMKLHITKNYLLQEICKDVGIKETDVIIMDEIVDDIINNYTNEGGVRKLKEHLYKIVRELNKANLTKSKIGNQIIKFPINLTKDIYNELYKSKPKYIHLMIHNKDGIGMVNGLWANSLGQGGVLPIESVLIPAKDVMTVKATGSLGEVIKESIEVALSVAWNKLDEETKNMWMNKWSKTPECFHIHCPDGSTGKEGPSAGAAMTTAFYSRLINKKVNHLVAMTGEINLREEVTEIGGLDEKLNAAKRGGATRALVPYNNKIDLENVIKNNPKLIDINFEVFLVSNFDEVIKHALLV